MARKKLGTGSIIAGILSIALLISLTISRATTKKEIDWSVVDLAGYGSLLPFLQAQAKHESGNFTSNLFRKANNMFGMGRPASRPTTDLGTKNIKAEGVVMANFQCPTQSVKDQLLYLKYFRFPNTVRDARDFAQRLKDRGYYADSVDNYTAGIERFLG